MATQEAQQFHACVARTANDADAYHDFNPQLDRPCVLESGVLYPRLFTAKVKKSGRSRF